MSSRLEANVSSGLRTDENHRMYVELLNDIDCLDPMKMPSAITSPWVEGEERLASLCTRFQVPFDSELVNSYRDFIENPNCVPDKVTSLRAIINTLPVSSADCERGFSVMNTICTERRAKLLVSNISDLLFISQVGPPLRKFNVKPCVGIWLWQHREAEDTDKTG